MSPAYYIVENGLSTGPHSLLVLKQKAEVHALRPDSLVHPAEDASGTRWTPIREIPGLHEHLFPAQESFALGAVRFDSANIRADASVQAFEVDAALRENTARQRAAEGDLLRDIGARPNNRRRDFIVCITALNLFVAFAGYFVGYGNPFLIGLCVMGNIGIAWVLYGVMDRY